MNQSINRAGEGWTMVVRKITDGPDSIHQSGGVLKPKKGDRLIWVHVTLRNDQGPRRFSWNRCDLDLGPDVILPSVVSEDVGIAYASDLPRDPQMDVGQSVDRRLIYAYPKGRSPTRLRCEPIVFALPQF